MVLRARSTWGMVVVRGWAHSLASPRNVECWRVGVSVRRAGGVGYGGKDEAVAGKMERQLR